MLLSSKMASMLELFGKNGFLTGWLNKHQLTLAVEPRG
jgi:hypothetical protein